MSATNTSTPQISIEPLHAEPTGLGWLWAWLRGLLGGTGDNSTVASSDASVVHEEAVEEDETGESYVIAPGGYRIRLPRANDVHRGINEIVPSMRDGLSLIPPLPMVVIELLKEIQNPNATASSVGNIAASDPALAASLIRTVNSAAFGLHRKITSASEAVNYLGFSTVKAMVLHLQLEQALGGKSAENPDLQALWTHSLIVSYIADCLARRIPSVDRGFVATLGLLHDIGKLVIQSRFPTEAKQLAEARATGNHEGSMATERQVLGVDHAHIGADIASQWGLPGDLIRAIRFHHAPELAFEPTDPKWLHQAVGLVQVANQLAKYCYAYTDEIEIDLVDGKALANLGFVNELTALLDDEVRAAASRAIFFAEDNSSGARVQSHRFLELHRGEPAAHLLKAVQGMPLGPTKVQVDDAAVSALFERKEENEREQGNRRRHVSGSATEAGLKTLTSDLRKAVAKLELRHEVQPAIELVSRHLLASVPTDRAQKIEMILEAQGATATVAIRAAGLSFADRFGNDCSSETALAALNTELANVVNLKWFEKITTSSDGSTLIFTATA